MFRFNPKVALGSGVFTIKSQKSENSGKVSGLSGNVRPQEVPQVIRLFFGAAFVKKV